MCGIVGMLAKREVAHLLVDGLRRLEYRGYDSAGLATLVDGQIEVRRAVGKLNALAEKIEKEPLAGCVGIGHTRWATHGKPNEANAHPHFTDEVAVVHNGIIENYRELRTELEEKGCVFKSETDTETMAQLLSQLVREGRSPNEAMQEALSKVEGAFAFAIIFKGHEDLLFGARRGSPLALGYGEGEMYLGSDALALAPMTNRVSYLEEGDWVELTYDKATIHDDQGNVVERKVHETALSGAMIGKGEYRHFMLKEIFEQPTVIADTLAQFFESGEEKPNFDLSFDWKDVPRLTIVACGTAYYAGMVGKYWFEQLAHLPVNIDVASEFRYRGTPMEEGGLMAVISQSGETADTLAAIKYAKEHGQKILSIVNVMHSSIARESDCAIPTLAGPEISVASTKAFTTQLTVLLSLAVMAGLARGTLDKARGKEIMDALRAVPKQITDVLREDHKLQELAQQFKDSYHALYLGRGVLFPMALEGALKLKEISYVHAEGYPAGELKHGPIALIDPTLPVVVLAPHDGLFEKTVSNVQEVIARSGKVLLFTDEKGAEEMGTKPSWMMTLPQVDEIVAPILYAIPVQLLAYYTALAKGTDVDQPRNLAKSVTVE